jgi:putative sugar O-methyltransferase
MYSANDSFQRFKALIAMMRQSFEDQESNEFSQVSPLWKTLFETRAAAVEFNDFLNFLSDSSAATNGAAGKYAALSEKARFTSYYRNYVEPSLLKRLPLSLVGTPTVFEYEGVACNTAYLENLNYYIDVERLVAPRVGWSNLKIAEIGAGYGGLASLFIKAGVAASYTIIDLPENLTLSSYYLTEQFSDLQYRVLSRRSQSVDSEFNGLTFVTPGNITALQDQRFDLVINTDSLGEMPAETAQAYVRWISTHLHTDGCFFSKNGHRRSSSGVRRGSEYGYQQMDLVSLEPIRTPSTLFADHSHLLVLSPRAGDGARAVNWSLFDSLCELYAIGLHDELKGVSAAFASGTMTGEQERFLTDVERFVANRSMKEKAACLGDYQQNELSLCACFLKGMCAFLAEEKPEAERLLKTYLAGASSHIAEALALFALYQLGLGSLDAPYRCGTRTQYMVDEVKQLAAFPSVVRWAVYAVRNELIRKKMTAASLYEPSALLKTKNLLLNVREGKGARFERH